MLHIIDEQTHNSACRWVRNGVSAKEAWKHLRIGWLDTYLGTPDHLRVDAGKQFVAKEFLESYSATGITINQVPIESPNSMPIVERVCISETECGHSLLLVRGEWPQ